MDINWDKPKHSTYMGNPLVKKAGVKLTMTRDEVIEYARCKNSVKYFTENYLKVIHLDRGLVPFNLYDYQDKMFEHFDENRFSIVLACRQSGKSISVCAYLLHYTLFTATKTVAILANKLDTAREMLGRISLMLENLPFFLQQGCKELNKTTIEFSNNSRILAAATSSSSIRGKSCVVGSTMVTVCDEQDNLYYLEIDDLINKSKVVKEEEMFYTVYKIVNKINEKIYVGFHKTNNLDDGYMGSGKLIKRALSKYGVENFTKEILKVFDTKAEAEAYEASVVDKDFTLREDTYNITIGGNVRISYGSNNGFYGKKHSPETLAKLSKSQRGHTRNGEEYIIDGNVVKGKTSARKALGITGGPNRFFDIMGDPDNNHKFVDGRKQKHAEERFDRREIERAQESVLHAERASKRFKGIPFTKAHKDKISASLMGHKKSVEWVNKINRNPEKIKKMADTHRGMKRSDESKARMSAAKKGKAPHNIGKVYCYDPISYAKKLCFAVDIPNGWVRGFVPKGKKC